MPKVEINNTLASIFTPTDFLRNQGLIYFEATKDIFSHPNNLFVIDSEEFHFSVSITQSGIQIKRNDNSLEISYDEINFAGREFCKIAFLWDPQNIGVAVNGPVKDIAINLAPTPISLINWAKKEMLIPSLQFRTRVEMTMKINECLNLIQDKIIKSGAFLGCWDIKYGKNGKILDRLPKRETDVQRLLHCFLIDQMMLFNIEIVPEYPTGIGDVDFSLIGNIKNQGMVKHFIEIKNGHSQDLIHGYREQLPNYMESGGAGYGTYCVLCYYGDWFDHPNSSISGVQNRLYGSQKGSRNYTADKIRIECLDLSKPITASKL